MAGATEEQNGEEKGTSRRIFLFAHGAIHSSNLIIYESFTPKQLGDKYAAIVNAHLKWPF